MRSFASAQLQSPAPRNLAPAHATRAESDRREGHDAIRPKSVADSSAYPAFISWDLGRISVYSPVPAVIQAKLAVNQPGDKYEQEADRVADQMFGMADIKPEPSRGSARPLAKLQRHEATHVSSVGPKDRRAPPSVYETLQSPGDPLDASLRSFFEPRFRCDFSHVRIHRSPAADQSASALGAHAYTVGSDIAFRSGAFRPVSREGRRLIAHELTHVVQQSSASAPSVPAMRVSTAALAVQRGPQDSMIAQQGVEFKERAARKAQYQHFVNLAKTSGLPTKFLIAVIDVTPILHADEDDGNAYNASRGALELKDSTLKGGERIMDVRNSNSEAVQALYHESTHAYLYQHRDESPVKEIYDHGMKHYENAPTVSGTVGDTEEAFQEAAAAYVGNRAAAWWSAFWRLNSIGAGKFNKKFLPDVQDQYDKAMAERIGGYSTKGHFWNKKQDPIKFPISDEMKTFLDSNLLENKIPDSYNSVPIFKAILASMRPK